MSKLSILVSCLGASSSFPENGYRATRENKICAELAHASLPVLGAWINDMVPGLRKFKHASALEPQHLKSLSVCQFRAYQRRFSFSPKLCRSKSPICNQQAPCETFLSRKGRRIMCVFLEPWASHRCRVGGVSLPDVLSRRNFALDQINRCASVREKPAAA